MNVPLVSLIFLKRSLVFPWLVGSTISLHWSVRKTVLCLLAILWNSAFKWVHISFSPLPFTSLLSQLFVRCPRTTIFPFGISSSWGWSWSPPTIQCYKPPSIVLQALYQITSLESTCHFHCIIVRNLIQVIPEWSSGFLYCFNLSLNFAVSLWSESQAAPGLCVCVCADCLELLHLRSQRISSVWFRCWPSGDVCVWRCLLSC